MERVYEFDDELKISNHDNQSLASLSEKAGEELTKSQDTKKITENTESLVPYFEKKDRSLAKWQGTLKIIITEPDTGINKVATTSSFRQLLNVCFLGELSEEQSLTILAVCRNLEQVNFKRRLLSFEQVDQIPETNRPLAGRLAVLLGLLYYRGEGIPHDYPLARRYFKLGMDLKQPEANLMAAFMAERGHGEENGEKNAKLRGQYLQSIQGDVQELKKAIIDVPSGVPQVNQTNINNNFPDAPMIIVGEFRYPGYRVAVAAQELDRLGSIIAFSAEELINNLKPHVITVAEHLYKAHQSYLRSGTALEERKLVARMLAKLYKERLEAFENYNPDAVMSEEEDPRTEEQITLEKAELDKKDALQDIALYAQYYYGLIDPSIFGQLRDSTAENLDILLTLILQDKVCSARSKMKRILELTEWQLPETLFDTNLQQLENLGHVAYQAVSDCLALISHGEAEHEEELVEELNDCQNFANAVLKRLKESETHVFMPETSAQKSEHFVILKARGDKLFKLGFQKMASQGFEGFARAMRFLVGKTAGSQELELSKNAANFSLFYSVLDQHLLLMLEPSELKLLMSDVIELIPAELRTSEETKRLDELLDDIDLENMEVRQGKQQQLRKQPDQQKMHLAKLAQPLTNPDKKQMGPAPVLNRLQNLADFCRILGQADIAVPTALQALSRKKLFDLFETGSGEGSQAARQLLQELFTLFNQHIGLIRPIEKAIQRYKSAEYQPSQYNFFSSTYGKDKEHAKELRAAKKLLKDCERCIFDRFAVLNTIKVFIEDSADKQHALSFALVLMKEMPNYDGKMSLKDFQLQFTSYCKRESKKNRFQQRDIFREIKLLNTLCKQFFDVRTGLSLELSKDFFEFLKTSALIGTIFPDDVFEEDESNDKKMQRRKHILFALYCYYQRSEDDYLALYQYLRDLEPRYFPVLPGNNIEVWKAWIFSVVEHTQGQIIDKLRHFNLYCTKVLAKDAPVEEARIGFEAYYAKAGLNRAIHQAWEQRKKVPKGFLPTLIATPSRNPEEVFYLTHINKCLSIKKEDHFRSCLQVIYHFLKDQNTPITKESYAYFLMDSLATELDRVDKGNNFRKNMDDWKARFTDIKQIRLEFTDLLKARYFNYDVVKIVASSSMKK